MPLKLVTFEQAKAALKAATFASKHPLQIDVLCNIASTEAAMRNLCTQYLMTEAFLNYFEEGEVKDTLKAAVIEIKTKPIIRVFSSVHIDTPALVVKITN